MILKMTANRHNYNFSNLIESFILRSGVCIISAFSFFCMPHKTTADSTKIADFETQYFSVRVSNELIGLIDPLLSGPLDHCVTDNTIIRYRKSHEKFPFFISSEKSEIDSMIGKFYKNEVSLTESAYIEDKFCNDFASGTMFVTGGTISWCVGDIEYWSHKIKYKEICPIITHEMVHVIQNELSGGGFRTPDQSLVDFVGPAWLFEGIAELFGKIAEYDKDRLDRIVMLMRKNIPSDSYLLSDMERFDRRSEYGRLHYQKGFIAAKYIMDQTSEDALFSFYRCIGDGKKWKNCFEEIFGLSLSYFYSIPAIK